MDVERRMSQHDTEADARRATAEMQRHSIRYRAVGRIAPGGCRAAVMPDGAVFGSTKEHKELREKRLREVEP